MKTTEDAPGGSMQRVVRRLTDAQYLVVNRLRHGNASTWQLANLLEQSSYRACSRLHGMAKAGLIVKAKPGSRADGDAIWALPPNAGTQRPGASDAESANPDAQPGSLK